MKKTRIIPVALLKDGFLVQSKAFSRYQNLGNPITAVKRLSEWGSDELIYLNISREDSYDQRRDDLRHPNRASIYDIIRDVSQVAFMPTTYGGRIRELEDFYQVLKHGADKVAICSQAVRTPELITQAAQQFGAQCVVVVIDAKRMPDGRTEVLIDGGRTPTGLDPVAWARQAQERGAGEIVLQAVHADGQRMGYDLELTDAVARAVQVPVIALGGAGEVEHFSAVLRQTQADAVAAANIFNYMDQSMYLIRKHLFDAGFNVRNPALLSFGTPAGGAR